MGDGRAKEFQKLVRNEELIPMRIMTYPRSSQLPTESIGVDSSF